jgi:hypothetical protein
MRTPSTGTRLKPNEVYTRLSSRNGRAISEILRSQGPREFVIGDEEMELLHQIGEAVRALPD